MNETNTSLTGVFPQAELDQMRLDSREASTRPLQWYFDSEGFRKDSNESAFVARQLESIRTGVYKIQYPENKFGRLVPANTEDDTGAEFTTFTIMDGAGQVLVSKDMSTATPMVNIKVSQQSTGIFSLRLGYQYSQQEARAAMFAKRPLLADQAMYTREIMERKLDDIIAQGETTVGLKGLLNQTSQLAFTPVNGQGGLTTFVSKSADEVLADLNNAPNKIVSNSSEIEIPNTAVFPTSIWLALGGRRVGDGTSEQISTYWKRTVQNITTVETTFKAETLGAGSTPRITFYRNDPTRIEYSLPQAFEQFAPQAKDLMIVTTCHMRTGGVILKLPKSLLYLDAV